MTISRIPCFHSNNQCPVILGRLVIDTTGVTICFSSRRIAEEPLIANSSLFKSHFPPQKLRETSEILVHMITCLKGSARQYTSRVGYSCSKSTVNSSRRFPSLCQLNHGEKSPPICCFLPTLEDFFLSLKVLLVLFNVIFLSSSILLISFENDCCSYLCTLCSLCSPRLLPCQPPKAHPFSF